MEINIVGKEDNLTKVEICYPWEALNQEKEKELQKIRKEVVIDGFRKGEAPLHLVKNSYQNKIVQRAFNSLYREAFENLFNFCKNSSEFSKIFWIKGSEDNNAPDPKFLKFGFVVENLPVVEKPQEKIKLFRPRVKSTDKGFARQVGLILLEENLLVHESGNGPQSFINEDSFVFVHINSSDSMEGFILEMANLKEPFKYLKEQLMGKKIGDKFLDDNQKEILIAGVSTIDKKALTVILADKYANLEQFLESRVKILQQGFVDFIAKERAIELWKAKLFNLKVPAKIHQDCVETFSKFRSPAKTEEEKKNLMMEAYLYGIEKVILMNFLPDYEPKEDEMREYVSLFVQVNALNPYTWERFANNAGFIEFLKDKFKAYRLISDLSDCFVFEDKEVLDTELLNFNKNIEELERFLKLNSKNNKQDANNVAEQGNSETLSVEDAETGKLPKNRKSKKVSEDA